MPVFRTFRPQHHARPPHGAVHRPDGITVLDWTNAPIYKLNESVPIVLDDKTVGFYVRFFFTYVRGRHGRFLIVESVDDIAWKDEPPPRRARRSEV